MASVHFPPDGCVCCTHARHTRTHRETWTPWHKHRRNHTLIWGLRDTWGPLWLCNTCAPDRDDSVLLGVLHYHEESQFRRGNHSTSTCSGYMHTCCMVAFRVKQCVATQLECDRESQSHIINTTRSAGSLRSEYPQIHLENFQCEYFSVKHGSHVQSLAWTETESNYKPMATTAIGGIFLIYYYNFF